MQRFKHHNQGARLPLTHDDILIARQTPCFREGALAKFVDVRPEAGTANSRFMYSAILHRTGSGTGRAP